MLKTKGFIFAIIFSFRLKDAFFETPFQGAWWWNFLIGSLALLLLIRIIYQAKYPVAKFLK